jgi:hypothetical protein
MQYSDREGRTVEFTPLLSALDARHAEVAKLLLDRGANPKLGVMSGLGWDGMGLELAILEVTSVSFLRYSSVLRHYSICG